VHAVHSPVTGFGAPDFFISFLYLEVGGFRSHFFPSGRGEGLAESGFSAVHIGQMPLLAGVPADSGRLLKFFLDK
jgi:hypothetical protein